MNFFKSIASSLKSWAKEKKEKKQFYKKYYDEEYKKQLKQKAILDAKNKFKPKVNNNRIFTQGMFSDKNIDGERKDANKLY